MTEDPYTFSTDHAEEVTDKNGKDSSVYGLTVDHTDVGSAGQEAVYNHHTLTTIRDVFMHKSQVGNVVVLSYKKRTPKTPYRVSYLDYTEEMNFGRNNNSYGRRFVTILEPFNSRASRIMAFGRIKDNGTHQYISDSLKLTDETLEKNFDLSYNEFIEEIDQLTFEEKFSIRSQIFGNMNLKDIRLFDDISVIDLLDIEPPEELAYQLL